MRIDLVVFDGLDELDALGPLEVLRKAAAARPEVEVALVTRTPQQVVRGANGLVFHPDGVFEPGAAEIVVVAGGGWGSRSETGVFGEVRRGEWTEPLHAARRGARVLCGVCTGTMLLASAGLVQGRRAATHASARGDLAAYGVTVLTDRVVDDGDLVTSGGVTCGIDLALHLVARELDGALAGRIARNLEVEWSPPAPRP